VLGWREKGRRERKIQISMNEFKLNIRPNSSIGMRVFLSSQFLSLEPSKGLSNVTPLNNTITNSNFTKPPLD
jgi:hypothetical protein